MRVHCDSRRWLYQNPQAEGVCLDRSLFAKQEHPVKATRWTHVPDTRNHHEHRTAPCAQWRNIPGESIEEVQAATASTARFVESFLGGNHITDFRGRGPSYHVHTSDGCEQTEETSVPGHELLVTRSRDRAGVHHCCGCCWRLDDGPDETPD